MWIQFQGINLSPKKILILSYKIWTPTFYSITLIKSLKPFKNPTKPYHTKPSSKISPTNLKWSITPKPNKRSLNSQNWEKKQHWKKNRKSWPTAKLWRKKDTNTDPIQNPNVPYHYPVSPTMPKSGQYHPLMVFQRLKKKPNLRFQNCRWKRNKILRIKI